MFCSSTLNPQVLFYDCHNSHFDDRASDILRKHNIQSVILKTGDYAHGQPNDNGPNMKLKNLYGNARMSWMRQPVTLKFTPAHINYYIIEK